MQKQLQTSNLKKFNKILSGANLKNLVLLFCILGSVNSNAEAIKCEDGLNGTKFSRAVNQQKKAVQVENDRLDLINRLNASWELTRLDIGELMSQLHGMENALYYTMTAILAKENIMADGPGGGAKTLAFRKVYEAQIRAVNKLNPSEIAEKYRESYELKKALVEIIQRDAKEKDSKKKIFTLQFHATMSETKILGGPDPFKFIEDGKYEIDYQKALIHESNMFALLDEIEKAPVALQMTLLSILCERKALVGNRIIDTLLESVAATTNATQGELISQALPHEIGGRQAYLDRFGLKVHLVNVSIDAMDEFLLLEKIERSKGDRRFFIIDLRGLRPLIEQVKISKEILDAGTEVSVYMDRQYTAFRIAAEEAVQGKQIAPAFYPSFSGSTRSQAKLVKLWQSAFLARQLLMGIPFEHRQMVMQPKDLIDLAPTLLQGGPDVIVPKFGVRVPFVQALDRSVITILGSNSNNPNMQRYNLSVGYYDPHTQIFQFETAKYREIKRLYFDVQNKKLIIRDSEVAEALNLDPTDISLMSIADRTKKFLALEETLYQAHMNSKKNVNFQKEHSQPSFGVSGRNQALLDNAPLRSNSKNQLLEIQKFHDEFLTVADSFIKSLTGKAMTEIDPEEFYGPIRAFGKQGKELSQRIKSAIQIKDVKLLENLSAESIRNSYNELSYLFFGTADSIKSLFRAIISHKNIMLFGPPGSAKTMISLLMLNKVVDGMTEAQIAGFNSTLADGLIELRGEIQKLNAKAGIKQQEDSAIWVKQFHPMSTEGDIVGRIDLAALKAKKGYTYNRTGSLSAKNVLFALLDEFEKAPPGVKTSLLSILNERQLLDGDEVVYSNLIAVILATNSTPGEFMIGTGAFSTSFPIYDRIHIKTYMINKLMVDMLKVLHQRMYLKIPMDLQNPLLIEPLEAVLKTFSITKDERFLLTQIHHDFMKIAVAESDAQHQMHLADPEGHPDFFMQTRGESNRSTPSVILDELPGAILLNRILDGQSIDQVTEGGFKFDIKDILAYAELFANSNGMVKIVSEYDSQGMIQLKVQKLDISVLNDRLGSRELKMFEYLEWESERLVEVVNKHIQAFMKTKMQLIAQNPKLYPSAFVNQETRIQWLKQAGFTDDQIKLSEP
jgi:MoxR-like ATPase